MYCRLQKLVCRFKEPGLHAALDAAYDENADGNSFKITFSIEHDGDLLDQDATNNSITNNVPYALFDTPDVDGDSIEASGLGLDV